MTSDARKHLLFLYVGYYFDPTAIPNQAKYGLLSRLFTGDVIAIVSERQFQNQPMAGFRLRGLWLPAFARSSTLLRAAAFCWVVLVRATWWHYTRKRYDAVVAPEPLVTGVIALMLRALTRSKVIIEVNGQFETAFSVDRVKPTIKERLKSRYASIVIPNVLARADAVKLLYAGQLVAGFRSKPFRHESAFPNFVTTTQFKEAPCTLPVILFLGYPWYLKGVDLLIQAFQRLTTDYPDYRLKIVGYCDDTTPFRALAQDNERIELCAPVLYPEVIKLMSECAVFVLPSRTEGIARVLSEAMACRKPIVASRVGGIPAVIRDGHNGLLFESGNIADLEAKLRMILSDVDLASRLAANGQAFVFSELSEDRYLQRVSALMSAVCEAR